MRSRRARQQARDRSPPAVLLAEGRARAGAPAFAWGERWLRGEEYALMLLRMEEYCEKFRLERYGANQHPPQIYQQPQNGCIYFLRAARLDALAYPRTPARKTYCWKKMNFPTLLPKADPLVRYLVASSFRSARLHAGEPPLFRMHVVVPVKFETGYMLCHIRRVGHEQAEEAPSPQLQDCFTDGAPDFYRLFLFLHNNYHCK